MRILLWAEFLKLRRSNIILFTIFAAILIAVIVFICGLTTFSDDEYIVQALKLGAKGYLLKQDYQNIVPSIRAVYAGQTVFGDEIVSRIPSLLQKSASFDYAAHDISGRELEIIRLIAEGQSNREIASQLYLSEGTVRNYLSSVLDKLKLRDRTQLAVFYYQHK